MSKQCPSCNLDIVGNYETCGYCGGFTLKFGKYRGKFYNQVFKEDKSYLEWLVNNQNYEKYPKSSFALRDWFTNYDPSKVVKKPIQFLGKRMQKW